MNPDAITNSSLWQRPASFLNEPEWLGWKWQTKG